MCDGMLGLAEQNVAEIDSLALIAKADVTC